MKLSNTALFYRMEREKAMYWLSTKKAKIIMLLPTLMIYAVFIIIPVFIAFYYSFTDYSGLGKASFVGIKNYVAMFHDKLFLIALKNTFLVLLFSVIFLIVGSFMAALLMNKNFHGNAFFKMVIFAPYVIAPIIIGIIWGYILNPNYGLGKNGHIAVKTNYIERAVNYLSTVLGVEFNEESAKRDAKGNLKAIYLKEEIGGFAVHLVQK